jgi:integrase
MKVRTAVRLYVARMRSLGYRYDSIDEFLCSFSKKLDGKHVSEITRSDVSRFLNGRRVCSRTWQQNHDKLSRFFRYLRIIGVAKVSPLPDKRRPSPKTFVPYIYTRSDLRRLVSKKVLERALTNPNQLNVLSPETMRGLLLFLYGTGVSVNEALNLLWENVDLKKRLITIGRHSDSPARTVPIGGDIRKLLMKHKRSSTTPFGYCFKNKVGQKISHSTLVTNFRHIRDLAGIVRPSGSHCQARMHDLRHTFAVHSITSWCRQGIDPASMIPALSAYLGQSGFSAQRYLTITPEYYRKQSM